MIFRWWRRSATRYQLCTPDGSSSRRASEPFFASPAHPYSLGLQQAFPNLARPRDVLVSIEGYPPDLREPPAGCRFAERCPFVQDACHEIDPELEVVGDGRFAACLRSSEMDELAHTGGRSDALAEGRGDARLFVPPSPGPFPHKEGRGVVRMRLH